MMAAQDLSGSVRALCICMIVFPTIAIMLRFWSRALMQGSPRFWWDDWIALFSWVMSTVELALTIWWTTFGLGKHFLATASFSDLFKGLHGLFVGYFFFYLGVAGPKYSCLLYYARVLNTRDRYFRIGLWFLHGVVTAWLLFCVISTIWQCTPIKKAWLPLIPGHCLDTYKWWSSSGISNIIIDVLILIFPMPTIWKLKMDRNRILLLIGVFAAGYCVVIVSIGKTVTILKDNAILDADPTYNIVPSLYWLSSEGPVSIISICLPAIFALCKRGIELGPYSLLSSKVATTKGSWSKSNRSHPGEQEGFEPLHQHSSESRDKFGNSDVYLESYGNPQ